MTHRKLYIAGPMTGIKNFNATEFDHWAKVWRARGWEVFNPADKDREIYGADVLDSETGDPKDAVAKGFDIQKTIEMDTEWIVKHATAIFMLKGWEHSKGARAEHTLAVWKGIDIFYE